MKIEMFISEDVFPIASSDGLVVFVAQTNMVLEHQI
jgi:hypothetical protein